MLDQERGKPDSTQGYIYRVRDTTPSISTLNFNQTFQFFIIKCIFDVEVTFIASFMFVIDVQADILVCSIFAIFAYSAAYIAHSNAGLHHTLDYTLIT
jgi:hypothetical protein